MTDDGFEIWISIVDENFVEGISSASFLRSYLRERVKSTRNVMRALRKLYPHENSCSDARDFYMHIEGWVPGTYEYNLWHTKLEIVLTINNEEDEDTL